MRRATIVVLSLTMTVGAVLVPGAASASAGHPRATRTVDGEMSGPGGFQVNRCGGTITEVGTGTFVARGLGVGTYTFEICVTLMSGGYGYLGSVLFTTRSGAELRGIVAGTSPSGPPAFTVWIDHGTRRFAAARGILTMGPFVQTEQTSCDPRVGICLAWKDTGPITGTLRGVRR